MTAKSFLLGVFLTVNFIATGCSKTWSGVICEETPEKLDCDGSHSSSTEAHFSLLSNDKSFHLDSSEPLGSLKGLSVSVKGRLERDTIHVASVERVDKKEIPSGGAGTIANKAPDSGNLDATGPSANKAPNTGTDSLGALLGKPPMTNSTIVSLKKQGIDDGAVIKYIQKADRVHFDLSKEDKVALSKEGIDDQVIAAMQARATRDLRKAPTPPSFSVNVLEGTKKNR